MCERGAGQGDVRAAIESDGAARVVTVGSRNWRGAVQEDEGGAGRMEDAGKAVRRRVEINGKGDAAGAVEGEIGGVSLGGIGGEEGYGIAGLDRQLARRGGETRFAAEQLGGRD